MEIMLKIITLLSLARVANSVASAGCNRVPCLVGKYYYGGFCRPCVGFYKIINC